jgi:uncharacterized protein YlxW (UPF0749 family)
MSRATLVGVTHGSHARPAADEQASTGQRFRVPRRLRLGRRGPRRGWGRWRVGTPLVVLLCGSLFVVSAQNSEGTDLRPGRYTDLASLAGSEARDYAGLRNRVNDLNGDIEQLTSSVDDREVHRYQRRIDQLDDPAGLVPRSGPGVTVTLADAPAEVVASGDIAVKYLVVHQQDIQAVVNAMWKAGARAVTIQGQRVVSTTGIKCEGPVVQLQGVPYPQPYRISAVGDPAILQAEIDSDEYLKVYREQAADPDIAVGWDLEVEDSLTAPAYDGLLNLSYATPLR